MAVWQSNMLSTLDFLPRQASREMNVPLKPLCSNVSTTPISAMGCRQCLSLSVVQLKGNHYRNGVVDESGQWCIINVQKHNIELLKFFLLPCRNFEVMIHTTSLVKKQLYCTFGHSYIIAALEPKKELTVLIYILLFQVMVQNRTEWFFDHYG